MTDEPPPLRGVIVYDCRTCKGRGRIHNTTCPDCQGRRVVVIQGSRVLKLTSTPRPDEAGARQKAAIKAELARKAKTRRNRLADVVCTACGDPSPVGTLCQRCVDRQKENDRRFRIAKLPDE